MNQVIDRVIRVLGSRDTFKTRLRLLLACGKTYELDVYAFGVILWQILTNEIPYDGMYKDLIVKYIRDDQWPPLERYMYKEHELKLWEIVGMCMNKDYKLRPTMRDVESTLRAMPLA